MKVIDRLDSNKQNEFSIMWNITHENILRYYDHFDHKIKGKYKTCVITEYCQVNSVKPKEHQNYYFTFLLFRVAILEH